MELLFSFGAFAVIMLLAAMSPGPDVLVVSKNSITHSRSIGAYTAIGVAMGTFVHVGYTLAGIGLLISQSIVLFSVVKIAGAVYLVYLGVSLIADKSHVSAVEAQRNVASITKLQALREGFITNVLNPKATVFFVAVFSQFLAPEYSFVVRAGFGLEAALIACMWFLALSMILTHAKVRSIIASVQERLLKVMGAALVLLGVKLASSQQ